MARSPLFDLYDPYGLLNGQEGIPNDDPTLADLMPQEEKSSMLRSLAEAGTSTLSTAGWLLDTPGALVRGVLAGKPLSFLGSSDDRVTGRELLRQYGMAGTQDTWGNFGGGLAAEILLDPLTYGTLGLSAVLGKGALGPAGRAAQAAGLMRDAALDSVDNLGALRLARGLPAYADDLPRVREYNRLSTPNTLLAQIADPAARQAAETRLNQQFQRFGVGPNGMTEAVGVLDDFRVPGTNIGFSVDGGAFGDAVARNADALGNWTKTAPVIGNITRTAASLTSPAAGPLGVVSNDLELTNALQMDHRMAHRAARDAVERVDGEDAVAVFNAQRAQVPEVVSSGPLAGEAIPRTLRQFQSSDLQRALNNWVESQPTVFGPSLPRTSGDAVADWVMENTPEFRIIRDSMTNLGPQAQAESASRGLPAPQWASANSDTGWIPRQTKWFERPAPPDIPGGGVATQRPWGRDARFINTADNFGRSRPEYTDVVGGQDTFNALTGTTPQDFADAIANGRRGVIDSRGLQQSLIGANERQARMILDSAFDAIGRKQPGQSVYQGIEDSVRQSPEYIAATPAERAAMDTALTARVGRNYRDLADIIRSADTQFAETGTGIYDTPAWENVRQYRRGQARTQANSDVLTNRMMQLVENVPAGASAGGVNIALPEAAQRLGYDERNFRQMWQARTGQDPTNFSINERYINALATLAPQTRAALPEQGLLKGIDNLTNAFKVGALASPAFHVRNSYSGMINAAAHGAFSPSDYWAAFQASRGNYDALVNRLRGTPAFEGLTDDQILERYIRLSGAQQVSTGNLIDDVSGRPEQEIRGNYPGASTGGSVARSFYNPERTWGQFVDDFTSMRGVGWTREAPSRNTNPLLVANDAIGSTVEDMLRNGTFINQLRKGVDPGVAGDLNRMVNVDYRPEAFTGFDRTFMKRAMPFWSFQKNIMPSIFDRLVYNPGGLQGQSIRAVTRGTEPTEGNMVPEHLRQSAAIPLPAEWTSLLGGSPKPGLRRYLTNVDLPWESTFGLPSLGVGATASARVADAVQRTGSNILGMANPLIKAPLEYITNRQLYSGRQLSDLYSVLEQDIGPMGRPLEQLATNLLPFGARAIGTYRQLRDDRLDPADRYSKAAFNLLAGLKLTDVDSERTKQLAARDMLNKLLSTTPGVRTYENITVPDDVLRSMPKEQRDMYLLYKIIQNEAAKRARDKKKAQAGMDPMQMLGLPSQF
jgi:hypothetical protein